MIPICDPGCYGYSFKKALWPLRGPLIRTKNHESVCELMFDKGVDPERKTLHDIENNRKDLIWRFVAVIFFAHNRIVDIWNRGQHILVMKHEANGKG